MFRSLASVFAGYVFWSVLWIGTNTVLPALFPGDILENEPITSMEILGVMLLWSVIDSILSGFTTGKIALGRPLLHGGILGGLLLVTGIAVQYAYSDIMPLWYHISFLTLLVPAALLGAMIGAKRTA